MVVGERLARLEEKVDGINDKLEKFIEAADKRYASKYIERMFWIAVAAVFTAIASILSQMK